MLTLQWFMMLLSSTATALRPPGPKALGAEATSLSKRLPMILRLETDESIPAGWRLATLEDAKSNQASLALVLREYDIASLSGGKIYDSVLPTSKMAGWGYSSRVEPMADPAEVLGHKLVVRFAPGVVLDREKMERMLRLTGLVSWRVLVVAVWLSTAHHLAELLFWLSCGYNPPLEGLAPQLVRATSNAIQWAVLIGSPVWFRGRMIARRGSI